jgi:hypothetical protein
MELLGWVSSEGGPLLVADAPIAQIWEAESTGEFYERACLFFENSNSDGGPIEIGPGVGVLWEFHGAGSAAVFQHEEGFTIVRDWYYSDDEAATTSNFANQEEKSPVFLGELVVESESLAIFWAAETGSIFVKRTDSNEYDVVDSTTGDSAMIVKLPKGLYSCLHDTVELPSGYARRFHLRKGNPS